MNEGVGKNDLVKRVEQVWSSFSQIIANQFNLDSGPPPESIEFHPDLPRQCFGFYLEEQTLHISRELLDDDIPLKGVVAKACFEAGLPAEILCNQAIDDFSNEFARQQLDSENQEKWVQLWSSCTAKEALSPVLTYNPSYTFPLLWRLTGPEALQRLVGDIIRAAQYGIEMSFTDYLRYRHGEYRRTSVSLDDTRLKIITGLLNNPSWNRKKLSDYVGISVPWLSRRISEMKKSYLIREFNNVPFSKVGIRMFHLLLTAADTAEDPFHYLVDCPFLFSYQNVLSGVWTTKAVLCVPDNITSMRSVYAFIDELRGWNIEGTLIEVASSGANYCLDFYSVETGGWDVPWRLLGVEAYKIYSEDLATAVPRIDREQARTKLKIDELDMSILECVRQGVDSVGRIRDRLRVGQHRVANKLKRLRKHGLIVKRWEAHHLGLVENVMVVAEARRTSESIGTWAQRLPKIIVSFDLNRRLLLSADLPSGGTYGMASCLRRLPERVVVGILAPKLHGAWGFPTDLWNAKEQRWEAPEEKIHTWFQAVR